MAVWIEDARYFSKSGILYLCYVAQNFLTLRECHTGPVIQL